jgi:ribosomal protein L24E
MEICDVCGKTYKAGWDRLIIPLDAENVYFCGEGCRDKWEEKELGVFRR